MSNQAKNIHKANTPTHSDFSPHSIAYNNPVSMLISLQKYRHISFEQAKRMAADQVKQIQSQLCIKIDWSPLHDDRDKLQNEPVNSYFPVLKSHETFNQEEEVGLKVMYFPDIDNFDSFEEMDIFKRATYPSPQS